MWACQEGRIEAAKWLVSLGLDPKQASFVRIQAGSRYNLRLLLL